MLLAGRKFVMEVLAIDSIEPRRFALRISCNKITKYKDKTLYLNHLNHDTVKWGNNLLTVCAIFPLAMAFCRAFACCTASSTLDWYIAWRRRLLKETISEVLQCANEHNRKCGFFLFTLESIDLVKRHRNSVINTSEDKSDPEFESALWVCLYYFNLAIENHIFVSKIGYFFLYDLHSSYTL